MGNAVSYVDFLPSALFGQCHQNQSSLLQAAAYCFGVASSFVGSLYVLVPKRVRQLERDDPLQIQWRSFATTTTCIGALLVYPLCFCSTGDNLGFGRNASVLELTGLWVPKLPLWNIFGALAHSMALYTGPLVTILVKARIISTNPHYKRAGYFRSLKELIIPSFSGFPLQRRREIWIALRNQVIAPVMEEIAFRGFMLPPLLATGRFHPWTVVWVAPVFFGLAHAHHAILRLQQGEPISRVLIMTIFQFLYTYLFGVYAGHAFLRSRSIISVILSHSFCNTMGLPSLQFLNKSSALHPYRVTLMAAHVVGIGLFAWGFGNEVFLPFMPLSSF